MVEGHLLPVDVVQQRTLHDVLAACDSDRHGIKLIEFEVCFESSEVKYNSSQHASLLRELTCHMGSHSVTCHLAEVTFLPLSQPIKVVLDLATQEGCKAELTYLAWLHTKVVHYLEVPLYCNTIINNDSIYFDSILPADTHLLAL